MSCPSLIQMRMEYLRCPTYKSRKCDADISLLPEVGPCNLNRPRISGKSLEQVGQVKEFFPYQRNRGVMPRPADSREVT